MQDITKRTLAKALACGFLLAAGASFFPFAAASEQLPQNVLRLHVVANSNSAQDQAVKLEVRDAILEEAAQWCGDAESLEQANSAVCTHLGALREAANQALKENGLPADARAQVTDMYFPTRYYGDVALPAGTYRTLRVTIGKGGGKNWWCVVFPALCLPAAENREDVLAQLPESQRDVVENPEKYQVKFKVAEWYEYLRSLLGA